MKIHIAQHVLFEGSGAIAAWAESRQIELSMVRLFDGEQLPDRAALEGLIVLGGPMGIYDEENFPWLVKEKKQIRAAIDDGKPVLGICLGAQLIADVLDARVFQGPQKEIGWFNIERSIQHSTFSLPESCTVLHWHGDTFDLPKQAIALASSSVTPHQGFSFKDHVVALQFHLETTPESLEALIKHSADELAESGEWIQSPQQLRNGLHHISLLQPLLFQLLDNLFLAQN